MVADTTEMASFERLFANLNCEKLRRVGEYVKEWIVVNPLLAVSAGISLAVVSLPVLLFCGYLAIIIFILASVGLSLFALAFFVGLCVLIPSLFVVGWLTLLCASTFVLCVYSVKYALSVWHSAYCYNKPREE